MHNQHYNNKSARVEFHKSLSSLELIVIETMRSKLIGGEGLLPWLSFMVGWLSL